MTHTNQCCIQTDKEATDREKLRVLQILCEERERAVKNFAMSEQMLDGYGKAFYNGKIQAYAEVITRLLMEK